jgi:antitoxin component of RelBE/YafQ-DinJ toxin-antitoxin module
MKENKTRLSFLMDDKLKEKAKYEADLLGMSFSAYVNMCVAERVRQNEVVDMARVFEAGRKSALAELAGEKK